MTKTRIADLIPPIGVYEYNEPDPLDVLTATVRANLLDLASEHGCKTPGAFARFVWPEETYDTSRGRLARLTRRGWLTEPERALELASACDMSLLGLWARLLAPRGAL